MVDLSQFGQTTEERHASSRRKEDEKRERMRELERKFNDIEDSLVAIERVSSA